MTVARCSCNAYRWCGAGEAKKCQNDCERLFAICIMRDRQVLCDAIVNCAGRNLNIYDLHSHWKKAIINVWGQKSGNFLQTFEPDSYLITAISKFVLHSGKNHKTLAKNKQNKNWQNYWWLRLWYFWQNEKKTADKMQIAITQSGWRPFWWGRGWLPQWPTPPTPPGLNLFFMYLKS